MNPKMTWIKLRLFQNILNLWGIIWCFTCIAQLCFPMPEGHSAHKLWWTYVLIMKVNYNQVLQKIWLIFGSSMGCYLNLAQGYLEVTCDILNNKKKGNELSMNFYMVYDALVFLWYSCYVYVFISYDYFYFLLTLETSYFWYDSFHTLYILY